MAILDNLAKAAKDFFVEPDEAAPAGPAAPRPLPATTPAYQPTATFQGAQPASGAPPLQTQPEQRHLDHIGQLLTGNGKDFMAYIKMVKSMAASGLSGPVLYQTAFNAFAAVTGLDLPALLNSADQFEQTLTADHQKILARHREKIGETPTGKEPASPLVKLQQQEQQLQNTLAELTRQLDEKHQELHATQQQLQAERQKAQTALASYELANTSAAAELQAHRQATQSFLLGQSGPSSTTNR
ncbi:hypothetical protein [Hymenobacter wooponensis]|uniref:Uncharacterized protein n=1 Tax=Hymenobacter wooponensis TaxID=1525360 RepID=A0A4Z0MBL2_9BACT|nr:hypothetical protein [Hymenobacter wooponensis]TGD77143.1 hypothetical protein EU557_24225 [Hymenobacter wooponensis]